LIRSFSAHRILLSRFFRPPHRSDGDEYTTLPPVVQPHNEPVCDLFLKNVLAAVDFWYPFFVRSPDMGTFQIHPMETSAF
jgi:hypothetical protein